MGDSTPECVETRSTVSNFEPKLLLRESRASKVAKV
jgi:hypothetical protein